MCKAPHIVLVVFLPLILGQEHLVYNKARVLSTDNSGFNPDVDLDPVQIIRRHGYPAETHIVQTEDGYLLSLHRIPGPQNSQPVFLQHGLLSSSADWVDEGNQSLAFMLADAGYDVWLGNARGNTYSKGHISLPIGSPQFWNFSWHEMGVYDLPAALYHVSNITQKPGDIIYVGHSMGGTMFLVFASQRPEAAKNVKFMVALAPAAYMAHVRSPIRYLSPFVDDFNWLRKHLGVNQFLPSNKLMKFLSYDCELLNVCKDICENLIFVLCGFDQIEFNEDILPVVLSHGPAGTSTKTVIHYAQEIKSQGRFQQYDYGPAGNIIQYGSTTPPLYKLEKIKVKTYIMYAENDWLVNPIDIASLVQRLTQNVGQYEIPLKSFNHVDFLFGKDAPRVVYKPLLDVIGNYTSDMVQNNLINNL